MKQESTQIDKIKTKKEYNESLRKSERESEEEFQLMRWVEETQFLHYIEEMTDKEKEDYIIAEYRKSIPANIMWCNLIYQKFKENEKNNE